MTQSAPLSLRLVVTEEEVSGVAVVNMTELAVMVMVAVLILLAMDVVLGMKLMSVVAAVEVAVAMSILFSGCGVGSGILIGGGHTSDVVGVSVMVWGQQWWCYFYYWCWLPAVFSGVGGCSGAVFSGRRGVCVCVVDIKSHRRAVECSHTRGVIDVGGGGSAGMVLVMTLQKRGIEPSLYYHRPPSA